MSTAEQLAQEARHLREEVAQMAATFKPVATSADTADGLAHQSLEDFFANGPHGRCTVCRLPEKQREFVEQLLSLRQSQGPASTRSWEECVAYLNAHGIAGLSKGKLTYHLQHAGTHGRATDTDP